MALTIEVLKQNQSLAGLTDEQLNLIAAMSQNDEATVIGARIGQLHGDYDKDIREATGVDKAQGEKTYDYLKRVLGSLKTAAGEADELRTMVTTLEKAAQSGSADAGLKSQMADLQTQLADKDNLINQLRTQHETEKSTLQQQIEAERGRAFQLRTESEFAQGLAGLRIKPEMEAVSGMLIDAAKTKILSSYKPDWVDNGQGGQVQVFRDASGNIARNPANGLNPYTAKELLLKELTPIIDNGQHQQGAGTQAPAGGGQTTAMDLSAAKTQIEADEAITQHLLKQGVTRGSRDFANQHKKLRDEAKVGDLPIR